MAAKQVHIDIIVDDKGTTKRVAVDAKKLGIALEGASESAQTTDRRFKGVAGATSNSTKAFSKMAQGITGGLVPAYATLAANIFAISAAYRFFKEAADLKVLEESQKSYTVNTGVALTTLRKNLREASGGMLGFREAAEASRIGLAKGFSPAQMEKIAEGARKVSNVLGRDFQDSFDRLTKGISKAEPELLDELGITLRLEKAKKDYALALDKNADSLTAVEESQAVYLATMKQLDKVTQGQEGKTNPFVELSNTFRDIVKTITEVVLPVFKSIARFLNENAVAAFAFFGIIGVAILKSMPFVEEFKDKFASMLAANEEGVAKAQASLDEYRNKIKAVADAAAQQRVKGEKRLSKGAGRAVAAGAESPVLKRVAAGVMTPQDKANLKKALKSAEAQYLKSGKITKGIFKDVSISIVRDIGGALAQTEKRALTFSSKVKVHFKTLGLQAKKLQATIQLGFSKAFRLAGRAARGFGKAMDMAMKATVILGIIQMVYDMVMSLVNAPYTIISGIIGVGKSGLGIIEKMAGAVVDVINWVINKVNSIPMLGLNISTLSDPDFSGMKKSLDKFLDSDFMLTVKSWEAQRNAVRETKAALDDVAASAKEAKDQLELMLADDGAIKTGETSLERTLATLRGMGSLDLEGMLLPLLSMGKEDQAKGLESITAELTRLGELSPTLARAFAKGKILGEGGILDIASSSRKATAGYDLLNDSLENMSQTLSGKSAAGVKQWVEDQKRLAEETDAYAQKAGEQLTAVDKLNKAFAHRGGYDAYIEALSDTEAAMESLAQARVRLDVATISGRHAAGPIKEQLDLQNKSRAAALNLQEKMLEMERLGQVEVSSLRDEEKFRHNQRILQTSREIELAVTAVDAAKEDMRQIDQLSNTLSTSLVNNLTAAFQTIVDGTTKAKDAFKNMALAILKDLAQLITRLLIFNTLKTAFDPSAEGARGAIGNFLGLDNFRYGGMVKKKYAQGGIARGRDAGYPAMLHGTEAVVPLPNNRQIPVDLRGGVGTNNVTVNVSMDGQGSSQENAQGDHQMKAMGMAISAAVQDELQRQKRPGGILSPYGAA